MGSGLEKAWKEQVDLFSVFKVDLSSFYSPRQDYYPFPPLASDERLQRRKIEGEDVRLSQRVELKYKEYLRNLHPGSLGGIPDEYQETGRRLMIELGRIREDLLSDDNFQTRYFPEFNVSASLMVVYVLSLSRQNHYHKVPTFKSELDEFLRDIPGVKKVSQWRIGELKEEQQKAQEAERLVAQLRGEVETADSNRHRTEEELQEVRRNHGQLVQAHLRTADRLKAYERITSDASPEHYLETMSEVSLLQGDLLIVNRNVQRTREAIHQLSLGLEGFVTAYRGTEEES